MVEDLLKQLADAGAEIVLINSQYTHPPSKLTRAYGNIIYIKYPDTGIEDIWNLGQVEKIEFPGNTQEEYDIITGHIRENPFFEGNAVALITAATEKNPSGNTTICYAASDGRGGVIALPNKDMEGTTTPIYIPNGWNRIVQASEITLKEYGLIPGKSLPDLKKRLDAAGKGLKDLKELPLFEKYLEGLRT